MILILWSYYCICTSFWVPLNQYRPSEVIIIPLKHITHSWQHFASKCHRMERSIRLAISSLCVCWLHMLLWCSSSIFFCCSRSESMPIFKSNFIDLHFDWLSDFKPMWNVRPSLRYTDKVQQKREKKQKQQRVKRVDFNIRSIHIYFGYLEHSHASGVSCLFFFLWERECAVAQPPDSTLFLHGIVQCASLGKVRWNRSLGPYVRAHPFNRINRKWIFAFAI